MRAKTLLLAAAAILILVAACSSGTTGTSAPAPAPSGLASLHIGVGTDEPGLDSEATDGTNDRSGFDYDLAEWLGLRHHVSPGFTDLTTDQRIPALQKDMVDIVIDSFSITDQRRQLISFAGPYLITQQGVMVRTGDAQIRVVHDLAGRVVCTVAGSTSLQQLTGLNAGPLLGHPMAITTEESFGQCMNDLLVTRSVEAVSTDELVLAGIAAHEPEHAVTVLPDVQFGEEERYGIGLPRGDAAACRTYTADIQAFIISGQWLTYFQQEFPELAADWQPFRPNPNFPDPCQ